MHAHTTARHGCTYRIVLLLRGKSLYGFYARDTRRYEVIQVVGGKNGAHDGRGTVGEGQRVWVS